MDVIDVTSISDYSGSPASYTLPNAYSSFVIDMTVTSGDSGSGQHVIYLPNFSNAHY